MTSRSRDIYVPNQVNAPLLKEKRIQGTTSPVQLAGGICH